MQLRGVLQPYGKRHPSHLMTAGLVHEDDDSVPVHALQLCGPRQPASSEGTNDEEEVVVESIRDVRDVGAVEMTERIWLGSEEIFGPEPVFGPLVVGPAHPFDPEPEPAEVERLDLASQVRMPRHEPRLQLELLQPGNRFQRSLDEQAIGDAHGSTRVPPRSDRVGGEVGEHGHRLA